MQRLFIGVFTVALIAWYAGTTALPEQAANAEGEWVSIGPTPLIPPAPGLPGFMAGRVAAIAVDPADPKHWLAGAATGGLWETRDDGLTWAPRTDDQPTLAIGAVAFAPSDAQTIYGGTGEGHLVWGAHVGKGVLKSTDGGASWTLLAASTFDRSSFSALHVHPRDPAIVVASTTRGTAGRDTQTTLPSPPVGVFKSSDGGQTWNRTLAGQATALAVDATNFNYQYAAIFDPQPGVANGVYRSSDGGDTWTAVPGPWGVSTARIALALAPSNMNVLYVSVQAPANPGPWGVGLGNFPGAINWGFGGPLLGLFRTNNAWAATPTWISVPTDQTTYCQEGACSFTHVLSVDPADPNTLFAGGKSFWRCRNCSDSPTWSGPIPGGIDTHSFAWSGNRVISGNDHGVLWSQNRGNGRLRDDGDVWEKRNGATAEGALSIVQFFSGALHPTDPNFIVANTQDNALDKWTGSNAWDLLHVTPRELGDCEGEVVLSSSRPNTDWACGRPQGGVSRTRDGQTWQRADAGISFGGSAYTAPLRKCPTNDDVFLTGTHRMYRIDNFFSASTPSWAANGPFPGFPATLNSLGTILAIEFAPGDGTCNIYAYGTRGGQIRLTMDGGTTWRDLDAARILPARPVSWLAFDPTNRNVLYAALSSFDDLTPGKPGHVFKTTNALSGSPSWTNVSPPDDQPHNVIAIDPRNNTIYVGTDAGIWYSADGGTGWQRYGPKTGLPNAPVYDLKINPTTNRIVAFTHGRGAFVLTLGR